MLPPGDLVTLTAAVRDLHKAYPNYFETDVRTRHMAIWENNPFIKHIGPGMGRLIDVHYDRIRVPGTQRFTDRGIRKKAGAGLHMITGYRDYISAVIGVPIPETSPYPDLYFSEQELSTRPIEEPYWVLFAGGKNDYTNKWWDPVKYQALVEMLKGTITFVQVGRKKDPHTPLNGVIQKIGETSLRELILLIKHANGVVCPITCGGHIAAGCGTPCVTIAGGREPPCWERYPGQTYLHTIGQIDCCRNNGCFKNRAGGTNVDDCVHVVQGPSIPQAACMDAIQPEHIAEAVLSFENGNEGVEQVIKVGPVKTSIVPPPRKSRTMSLTDDQVAVVQPPITICTVLYGDFHKLHRRCINSIIQNTPKGTYTLRIGCNEVCQQTLDWLESIKDKASMKLYVEPKNIYKYPLMRRLFNEDEVTSRWVCWFDDDSHVTEPHWLNWLADAIREDLNVDCWGREYYTHLNKGHMREWAKKEPWYAGRPWAQDHLKRPALDKVDFSTGGFWVIRTEIIKKHDWPSGSILGNGGDVWLGGLLWQQGYNVGTFYKGIAISDAKRRGYSEKIVGILNNEVEQKRQQKYVEAYQKAKEAARQWP